MAAGDKAAPRESIANTARWIEEVLARATMLRPTFGTSLRNRVSHHSVANATARLRNLSAKGAIRWHAERAIWLFGLGTSHAGVDRGPRHQRVRHAVNRAKHGSAPEDQWNAIADAVDEIERRQMDRRERIMSEPDPNRDGLSRFMVVGLFSLVLVMLAALSFLVHVGPSIWSEEGGASLRYIVLPGEVRRDRLPSHARGGRSGRRSRTRRTANERTDVRTSFSADALDRL
jgi:hypothetical protein